MKIVKQNGSVIVIVAGEEFVFAANTSMGEALAAMGNAEETHLIVEQATHDLEMSLIALRNMADLAAPIPTVKTAVDSEDEDSEEAPKRVKTRKAKSQRKVAPTKPEKRQAPAIKPDAGGPINGEHSVGILEDGTVVVIDWEGHAMSLSPVMARKIAELVARTS